MPEGVVESVSAEIVDSFEELLADMRQAAGEQGWINNPLTLRLAGCIVSLNDYLAETPDA